jgi:hypothetical protein
MGIKADSVGWVTLIKPAVFYEPAVLCNKGESETYIYIYIYIYIYTHIYIALVYLIN